MKQPKRLRIFVLRVVFPLIIGVIIYLLFRPLTLKGYDVFNLQIIGWIKEIQENYINLRDIIPIWIIYTLPDGLWIFSFTSAMLLLVENKKQQVVFSIIPIAMAVFHELSQLMIHNYGTFDLLDLITYFVFYFFSIFSFYSPKNFITLLKINQL